MGWIHILLLIPRPVLCKDLPLISNSALCTKKDTWRGKGTRPRVRTLPSVKVFHKERVISWFIGQSDSGHVYVTPWTRVWEWSWPPATSPTWVQAAGGIRRRGELQFWFLPSILMAVWYRESLLASLSLHAVICKMGRKLSTSQSGCKEKNKYIWKHLTHDKKLCKCYLLLSDLRDENHIGPSLFQGLSSFWFILSKKDVLLFKIFYGSSLMV